MTKRYGSRLSRRSFLAGTAALGAAAVAGVRPALAYDFQIPAPITDVKPGSSFHWLDSGDQKAVFFNQFFPAYDALRGTTSQYDGMPYNEIARVVPLGIRNGTAPDVFELPLAVQASTAVQEGWVRPYDDLIPDIEAWKAGFPDGVFLEGINVFEGKTYGLPYTSARFCAATLLFNKKLLADAGYDPEAEPLTWETFRDAAAKITAAGRGQTYGLIIGGNQVNRWDNIAKALAQMGGAFCGSGALVNGMDLRTGKYIFDSDPFVEAVELLIAMREDGSIFPGTMSINAPQARAFMPQGVSGMILQGPWNVPQWERENPEFDFGIAPPPAPAGVSNGCIIGGGVASAGVTKWINAQSRNPEVAADIFHYLGTEAGQIDWANIDGVADAPVFPSAIQKANVSDRSKQIERLFQEIVRIAPNPFVRNPALAEVVKVYKGTTPGFAETVQGLYTGQIENTRAALADVNARSEAALDEAIAAAQANGAEVSRDDFVFPNWDTSRDFMTEDYA